MTYSLTRYIKDKAIEIGFEKIGITKATSTNDEKVRLEKWIKNNHHGSMSWIEKRKDERGNIHSYFPAAKSVISLGMNYNIGKNQDDLKSDFKISNYAWGDDYHEIIHGKLKGLELSLIHISEPTRLLSIG